MSSQPQRNPIANGTARPNANRGGRGRGGYNSAPSAPLTNGYTNGAIRPQNQIHSDPSNSGKKSVDREQKVLVRHEANNERSKRLFDEEIAKSELRMKVAFEELRATIAAREAHVKEQFEQMKLEGAKHFSHQSAKSKQLHMALARVPNMSDPEVNQLRNEIRDFCSDLRSEEEESRKLRFTYHPDQILAQIRGFGEVTPFEDVAGRVSRRISRVSGTSSHSQLDKEVMENGTVELPKEDTKVLECNGVTLASSTMSMEQLAAIQQQFQESMRKQGLSEEVIKSLSNVGPVQPQRANYPRGGRGGRGNGPRGNYAGRGRGASRPDPKISILEEKEGGS